LVVFAVLLANFLFPLGLLIVADILPIVHGSGSCVGTDSRKQHDCAQNAQQTKNQLAMT
jgi:hypothetical protein